ncbi:MAG: IreB family regulatory phosphoprotein [Clostridiaceae bacterium]|nr:IreB family regulatory phosphoprotein [Clostridiaceae bacterium]
MGDKLNLTMKFDLDKEKERKAKEIIMEVYESLEEKGYNPINQFIGYILSGDPTYITNHNNARSTIRDIERDELLEELLKTYLEKNRS